MAIWKEKKRETTAHLVGIDIKDALTLVPGSATAYLSGLRGSGSCGGDGEAVFTLDY